MPLVRANELELTSGPLRRAHVGRRYPRDHFCSHTQAHAANTHPRPTSGLSDMNVHTAALMRHNTMAKTPARIFAMDQLFTSIGVRDLGCHAA